MGREASATCTLGALTEPVKALLESREIIVRGTAIKRRFAVADLRDVRIEGDRLHFEVDGTHVLLHLGAAEAAKWITKISAPPPTLAAKLGIGPDKRAVAVGPLLHDAALAEALTPARTGDLQEAMALVATVLSDADLQQAVSLHGKMACRALWVVYEKAGRSAGSLGDGRIRETLRALGYRDNKACAVSERLTATRYLKP